MMSSHVLVGSLVVVALASCRTSRPSQSLESPQADIAADEQDASVLSMEPARKSAVGKVNVQIIKSIDPADTIEQYVANVFTVDRVSRARRYLATKIPCQAQFTEETAKGELDCRYNDRGMAVMVSITRQIESKSNRLAKVGTVFLPRAEVQQRDVDCELRYNADSLGRNRGPEATRAGSVLHKLEEVSCAE